MGIKTGAASKTDGAPGTTVERHTDAEHSCPPSIEATEKRSCPQATPSKSEQKIADPAAAPAVPGSLSRDDVQTGMRRILAKMKRCGNGKSGTITITMTINPDGRVTKAAPKGPYADNPIGYCVTNVVKTAHFPKSHTGATIQYPFSLQ